MWLVNLAVYGSMLAAVLDGIVSGHGVALVLFICACAAVTLETLKGFLPRGGE